MLNFLKTYEKQDHSPVSHIGNSDEFICDSLFSHNKEIELQKVTADQVASTAHGCS